MPHPCLTCGACCARFRVSFYWAEGDDATTNGVPVDLTEKLDQHRRVMRGTNRPGPRCAALEGSVGASVCCSIYQQRPSVCRDFEPAWAHGAHSERCDRARLAWGLAPLTPGDWLDPGASTRDT